MGSTLEDRASARPRAQPATGSGAVASSATQRATQTSPTTATTPLESLPAVPRSSKLRSKCRRPRLRISLQIPTTEFTNPTRSTGGSPPRARRTRPQRCSSSHHSSEARRGLLIALQRVIHMPSCSGGCRRVPRVASAKSPVGSPVAMRAPLLSRLQRADPAAAPKARSVSAPSAPDSQSQAPAGPLAT
jgi:hypothetical protein